MRRSFAAIVMVMAICLSVGCGDDTITDPPTGDAGPEPLAIEVPGFPPLVSPDDNPLTREGVTLGRRLFYDPILSGDSTQSCAGCHAQPFGFSDNGLRFSVGIDGVAGDRNAPAIINAAWGPSFFWDGRAGSLEVQALEPVPNPIEMHEEWDDAVAKLSRHDTYPEMFGAAFGTRTITSDRVVKAIAQFERTLISDDSKFDRYRRQEVELTPSEARGLQLFFTEAGDCFHCHGTILVTDNEFHNNGLDATFEDLGLGVITGDPNDNGKFKTPTLRNIAFTAPYMHDGRFGTLEEVLDHYNSGGVWSETVDPLIRVGGGLGLTDTDIEDLIAYLRTLSDSTFVSNPDYANPFE